MRQQVLYDMLEIVHILRYTVREVVRMNGYERRKRAKMDQIEAAALRLFRQKGVSATSVEQIAAEAGVSKVSIYNYYGDKQALARQIIFDSLGRQSEHFDRVMRSDLCFSEKYEALIAEKTQALGELTDEATGGLLDDKLLQTPEMQAFMAEHYAAQAVPLLRELIEQGKREGAVNKDIPTDTILLYIEALQRLVASKVTMRQRQDLGILFQYGFIGQAQLKEEQ